MKPRSLILYGSGFILCCLAILALVIDTRFRICKWTDTFSTNSIHASDEDIQMHCSRQMGAFRFLYEKHPD